MDSEMRDGASFQREMRFEREGPSFDQCEFDLLRWCGRINIQRFMRLTKRRVSSSFDLIRSLFLSIRQAPNATLSFLSLNNLQSGIRRRTTAAELCKTAASGILTELVAYRLRPANRFQSVEATLYGMIRTWIIPYVTHCRYYCNFKETNLAWFDKITK